MKDNQKKFIIALVAIIIVVIIILIATNKNKSKNNEDINTVEENTVKEEFVQVLEDGTKLNISSKLAETKTVNGLEFGNIQLTEQGGQSLLLADVKNNTSNATELTLVDLTLLDKEGNTIVELGGIIAPLAPGESTQFNTSTTLDYANAYDFKVEVKK